MLIHNAHFLFFFKKHSKLREPVRNCRSVSINGRAKMHFKQKWARPVIYCFLMSRRGVCCGDHCLVIRGFRFYWSHTIMECLSTHHCQTLNEFFIPSFKRSRLKTGSRQVKYDGKTSSSQTLVTLSRSFWKHSFKYTFI